jgi:glycosyltransferase involved in cell wall biosynthesis
MGDYQAGKDKPFVSVVICTRNRREYLEKYSIPSVLNLSYPNYEVIVVCDNPIDGTELFLENYKDPSGRLRIVRNRRSNGIAHARNLGVYYAQGEIVAFTDDDCLVDVNWLTEFIDKFLENKNLMAVGGFTYDGYSDNPTCLAQGIFAFNMAFRKKVFERFLFDKNLFFHKAIMHEETDLVKRLEYHGYLTGYVPKALVRHFFAPAAYRRINNRIGSHLNAIYMDAKKFSLARYYYKFFKRSNEMFRKIKQLYREGVLSFFETLFKIGWVNYILFFELPLKAKITNIHEEKVFNLGTEVNKARYLFLRFVQ